MEGIIFDAANGPMMDGTWRNPKNGDKFTVRDTFFQDNQFIVQTTDGRMLDYNFVQDYVKLEKETEEDSKMMDNIFNKQQTEELPDEVKNLIGDNDGDYSSMMLEEDAALINKTPGAPSTDRRINISQHNTFQNNMDTISEDDLFIRRALSSTTGPDLKSDIEWTMYPKEKIHMLRTLFDIDIKSIALWYMKNIDMDTIRKNIEKTIINYIEGQEKVEPKKQETTEAPREKHPLRSKKVSK